MLEEWTKQLTPSMLSNELYRAIATEIGMDNFLKLSQLVNGDMIYIPQQAAVLRPLRDQQIQEEYDGFNAVELSRKYGISKRWVNQIVSQGFRSNTSEKKQEE